VSFDEGRLLGLMSKVARIGKNEKKKFTPFFKLCVSVLKT
jgi:hypothetical protein